MYALTNDSLPHDSLCPVTWRSRPGNFVSLMTLYESNYIRLRQLLGDVTSLPENAVSHTPRDCALYLRVDERSRYTVTFTLTYKFGTGADELSDPDLQIRIYHDARLAEALRCSRWEKHPTWVAVRSQALVAMRMHGDQRWQRNMMLNKWLDYCTECGHGFAGGR